MGIIRALLGHKLQHELAVPLPEVTDSDVQRIRQLSNSGFSPLQICETLRSEGSPALWHQVHYRWSIIQRDSYLKCSDPLTSCAEFVKSCSDLNLIYYSELPRAIAFTTSIGE